MLAIQDLAQQCAPDVAPALMSALVRAESAWRPFAIGMDSNQGRVKQPASLEEAVATAESLEASGRRFSVGLAQIHISNVKLHGLTWGQAFDPCTNLRSGQKILWTFFLRAAARGHEGVAAVWGALRGYNSGSVDRQSSDDYARRIFKYMGATTPSGLAPLARLDVATPPAVDVPKVRLPEELTSPAAAEPIPKSKTRSGESLEIFEKDEVSGF